MGMELMPMNPGGDLVEVGPSSDFADAPADHAIWGWGAGCQKWATLQCCVMQGLSMFVLTCIQACFLSHSRAHKTARLLELRHGQCVLPYRQAYRD